MSRVSRLTLDVRDCPRAVFTDVYPIVVCFTSLVLEHLCADGRPHGQLRKRKSGDRQSHPRSSSLLEPRALFSRHVTPP